MNGEDDDRFRRVEHFTSDPLEGPRMQQQRRAKSHQLGCAVMTIFLVVSWGLIWYAFELIYQRLG